MKPNARLPVWRFTHADTGSETTAQSFGMLMYTLKLMYPKFRKEERTDEPGTYVVYLPERTEPLGTIKQGLER
jgi:hypothetical protein